jgi:hypothetical protein
MQFKWLDNILLHGLKNIKKLREELCLVHTATNEARIEEVKEREANRSDEMGKWLRNVGPYLRNPQSCHLQRATITRFLYI